MQRKFLSASLISFFLLLLLIHPTTAKTIIDDRSTIISGNDTFDFFTLDKNGKIKVQINIEDYTSTLLLSDVTIIIAKNDFYDAWQNYILSYWGIQGVEPPSLIFRSMYYLTETMETKISEGDFFLGIIVTSDVDLIVNYSVVLLELYNYYWFWGIIIPSLIVITSLFIIQRKKDKRVVQMKKRNKQKRIIKDKPPIASVEQDLNEKTTLVEFQNKQILEIRQSFGGTNSIEELNNFSSFLNTTIQEMNSINSLAIQWSNTKDDQIRTKITSLQEKIHYVNNSISNLLPEIRGRTIYVSNWEKIINAVDNLSPNIQIPLTRISELTRLSPSIIKPFLKTILMNNPGLGDLLEVEEIFIKHQKGVKSEKLRELKCLYCNTELESFQLDKPVVCSKCGKKAPFCEVCKNIIIAGDKVLQSTNCDHIFHKEHILEWINVKSECPVCKEKINEENLHPYSVE